MIYRCKVAERNVFISEVKYQRSHVEQESDQKAFEKCLKFKNTNISVPTETILAEDKHHQETFF